MSSHWAYYIYTVYIPWAWELMQVADARSSYDFDIILLRPRRKNKDCLRALEPLHDPHH